MKLVSVNTGMPREVKWHGRVVTTAIFKEPVKGRITLRKLNLDGDRQADLLTSDACGRGVELESFTGNDGPAVGHLV